MMTKPFRNFLLGAAVAGVAPTGVSAFADEREDSPVFMADPSSGAPVYSGESTERFEPAPDLDLAAMFERRFSRKSLATAYAEPSTGRSFVLDRSGSKALLKFADDPEVYVLKASNGPRGDEFLRGDSGDVFVRVTDLGNVILYPEHNRGGMPTDKQGETTRIGAPAAPESLAEYAEAASMHLNDQADIQAGVIISGGAAAEPGWARESLDIAVRGIFKSGPAAAGLSNIYIEAGSVADVTYKDGVLALRLAPDDGYAGRPSSDKVAKTIKHAAGAS